MGGLRRRNSLFNAKPEEGEEAKNNGTVENTTTSNSSEVAPKKEESQPPAQPAKQSTNADQPTEKAAKNIAGFKRRHVHIVDKPAENKQTIEQSGKESSAPVTKAASNTELPAEKKEVANPQTQNTNVDLQQSLERSEKSVHQEANGTGTGAGNSADNTQGKTTDSNSGGQSSGENGGGTNDDGKEQGQIADHGTGAKEKENNSGTTGGNGHADTTGKESAGTNGQSAEGQKENSGNGKEHENGQESLSSGSGGGTNQVELEKVSNDVPPSPVAQEASDKLRDGDNDKLGKGAEEPKVNRDSPEVVVKPATTGHAETNVQADKEGGVRIYMQQQVEKVLQENERIAGELSDLGGKLGIANTRVQELEEQLALEKGKAEELATQLSEANTKLENLPVSNQQYKLHSDLLVGDRVNRTYKLPIKLVESIADDAEKSGETVLDLVTMRLATSKEKTIMSDTKSGS